MEGTGLRPPIPPEVPEKALQTVPRGNTFASKLIRQKVGGFLFDVGCLERCKACQGRPRTLPSMSRTLLSMLKTLQSMPRSAKDVAKHA